MAPQKYVVIGAGPVGAMAAMYAAERGHDVEVYELRNDLRDPSTIPLNFTKSINLSLSERGINAIKKSGRLDLLDKVMQETTPVRGRMIHGRGKSGILFEEAQDYDIHGRTNYACDRGALNAVLLDALQAMPNVKLFFNHKLVGADFKSKKAWLEVKTPSSTSELEITFDLMIGADGAHSATRYHLMKYTRMDYKQEYIDTLWCEFRIEQKLENWGGMEDGGKSEEETFKAKFKMSPNHLHIWPGKDHMFIAIPSQDGSFTCTLFMPSAAYTSLSHNPSNLVPFFDTNFPGVSTLISPTSLQHSFAANPHLPLISITCTPYHYTSTAVILGDAAHAMVPFYGQGMNAGLESVYTLFSLLDSHLPSHIPAPPTPTAMAEARANALAEYSRVRAPDAAAIEKLALDNYLEMRSSVTSPLYKLRKNVEEFLSINFPGLGVVTKYSLVSFGNNRYSEVVKSSDRQGHIIRWAMMGLGLMPLAGVTIWALWRWVNFTGTTRWTIKKQAGLGWGQRGWL